MSAEDVPVEELDFGLEDPYFHDNDATGQRLSMDSDTRRSSNEETQGAAVQFEETLQHPFDAGAVNPEAAMDQENLQLESSASKENNIPQISVLDTSRSEVVKQEVMVQANGGIHEHDGENTYLEDEAVRRNAGVGNAAESAYSAPDVNNKLVLDECRDQLAELTAIINPSAAEDDMHSDGASDDESGSYSGSSVDSSASSDSDSGDEKSSSRVTSSSGSTAGSRDTEPKSRAVVVAKNTEGGRKKDRKPRLCDSVSKLEHFYGNQHNTQFILIKSGNKENVSLSKAKGVWATTPRNESQLNSKFTQFANVILVFSVERSQAFQGFCRLASKSSRNCSPVQWVLPVGMAQRSLGGLFKVQWLCRCELPFANTVHLANPWNENKPVKIGRDGTEIEYKVGRTLCDMFPYDSGIDLDRMISRTRKPLDVKRPASPKRPQYSDSGRRFGGAGSGSSRRGDTYRSRRPGGDGGGSSGRGSTSDRYSRQTTRAVMMGENYYGYDGMTGAMMPAPYDPYNRAMISYHQPPTGLMYDYYQYGAPGPYPLIPQGPPSGKVTGGNTEMINRDKYENRVAAFIEKATTSASKKHSHETERYSARKRHSEHTSSSSRRRHEQRHRSHSGSRSRHADRKRHRH